MTKKYIPLLMILVVVAFLARLDRGPSVAESYPLVVAANQAIDDEIEQLQQLATEPNTIKEPSQLLTRVLEARDRLRTDASELNAHELAPEVDRLKNLYLERQQAFDGLAGLVEKIIPVYEAYQKNQLDPEHLSQWAEEMQGIEKQSKELYETLVSRGSEFQVEMQRFDVSPSDGDS